MRRLWFKAEMREAILEGRKSATTRTKRLITGEVYQAVSGSRFKAIPFSKLRIMSCELITIDELITKKWQVEGFLSANHAREFLQKELPRYALAPELWHHTFTVTPEPYTKEAAGADFTWRFTGLGGRP